MSNGKVEEMLTQLIQIVGSMQSDFQEMKGDIQGLKDEFQEMKSDTQGLKADIHGLKGEVQGLKGEVQGLKDEFHKEKVKNEERHKELLGRFKSLENDQDFIWEKTVRNEREIANIKGQLSNQ